MKPIKKMTAVITAVRDLTPTAKELTITLPEPFEFVAGSFVNLFVDLDREKIRRAYSMTSGDGVTDTFTISVRHSLAGRLTPRLWQEDFTGKTIEVMGPLGLNTIDKMKRRRLFLFGFGIGAGVVKSLAEHALLRPELEEIVIMTGNRSEEDIVYREYFDSLIGKDSRVTVTYVVSQTSSTFGKSGYIQDNIAGLSFHDADIYICGQTVACDGLRAAIMATNPNGHEFFVEDFH